jgi:hypothetical protein
VDAPRLPESCVCTLWLKLAVIEPTEAPVDNPNVMLFELRNVMPVRLLLVPAPADTFSPVLVWAATLPYMVANGPPPAVDRLNETPLVLPNTNCVTFSLVVPCETLIADIKPATLGTV